MLSDEVFPAVTVQPNASGPLSVKLVMSAPSAEQSPTKAIPIAEPTQNRRRGYDLLVRGDPSSNLLLAVQAIERTKW